MAKTLGQRKEQAGPVTAKQSQGNGEKDRRSILTANNSEARILRLLQAVLVRTDHVPTSCSLLPNKRYKRKSRGGGPHIRSLALGRVCEPLSRRHRAYFTRSLFTRIVMQFGYMVALTAQPRLPIYNLTLSLPASGVFKELATIRAKVDHEAVWQ